MNSRISIVNQKEELNILFAGDLCPMGEIEQACKDDQQSKIVSQFQDYFKRKDIFIANLECPLTTSNSKSIKVGPHLKADPLVLKIIQQCSIDVLNLANNHIVDYGNVGLSDTTDLLKQNGLMFLGAGNTVATAYEPLRMEKKNINLSFLTFAENAFNSISSTRAGCAQIDLARIIASIENEKQYADHIIISLHASPEHYPLPSPRIRSLCRTLADSGASAIVCHHSHTCTGYEIYNGIPIFYGLGNFLFDRHQTKSSRFNYMGLMVRIGFNKMKAVNFELKPFEYDQKETTLRDLDESQFKKMTNRIESFNQIIQNDQLFDEIWSLYAQNQYKYNYAPNLRRLWRIRSFITHPKGERDRRLLHYRLHESHIEVINTALNQLIYGLPTPSEEAIALYEKYISDITLMTKFKRFIKMFI